MTKLQSITFTAAIILGISSSIVSAAIEACPTRSACKSAAGELGIDDTLFYADREGVYPTKGCYTKTNSAGVKKAFWSQGTIDEMETILDDPLERLYCQVEVEDDKQPRVDWKAFDSNSVDHNNYSSDGFIWELDTSGSEEGTGSVQQFTESESNSNADINSGTSSRVLSFSVGVVAMAIVASL